MRRLPLILSVICVIILSASVVPVSVHAVTTPQLLKEINLDDSQNDKYPNVTVSGQTVYIGGGVSLDGTDKNTDVFIWSFAEQATSIGPGTSLGTIGGKRDYSSAAVTTAPDGTIYAVWSNIDNRTLSIRHRDSSGAWGARHIVASGTSSFFFYPKVAVDSFGQVFVIWQDNASPLFLKVSNNQGASWSSKYTTTINTYTLNPTIATGPNGQVVVGYTTVNLAPAVAIWTGSGLSTEVLMGTKSGASTGTSIGPDGKIYAAWRGLVSSGSSSGAFYAERQSENSWNRSHMISGDVKNTVNVLVDSSGSIHLGWNTITSGTPRFFYSIRQAGQPDFSALVPASIPKVYNSHFAVSSGGAFVHVALENFTGLRPFITYARFSGSVVGISATPQIDGGAAAVGGSRTRVDVTFTHAVGLTDKSQVRWHWNSAPTDGNGNDGLGSQGWQTYANPLSVPIPASLLSSTTCAASTLYTQLRNPATGVLEETAKQDAILVDEVLQGTVDVHNPYINIVSGLASTARSAAPPPELALSKGEVGSGDPNYTRVPLIYLSALSANDCTGITSIAVGRSASALETTYKSDGSGFSGMIPLPDLANLTSGPRPIVVQLQDGVGNTRTFPFNIIYDDTKPTIDLVNSGLPFAVPPVPPVTATAVLRNDILQNLTFTNIIANDDYYPGRKFRGVWIANSRTAIGDPLTNATLKWKTVIAPGSRTSFTLANWSLATGLAASEVTPGTYYIYIRLLDGAGNASSEVFTLQLTSNVTLATMDLPLVVR